MNRAMFSGVAGMKAHQSKMDVIGNNIANVNTYGYKSQRAVFSDIFYQSLRSASAGTANRGGTNPSTVGYGSSLSAVQTQMGQSSMQSTGFGLDVAIMGEGFLQVMDPDGNIFYTKAGMLDYDANGYLTDINGNFVLGSTGANGQPGTQKIRLDNIGNVTPAYPSYTKPINSINYTVQASNASAAGNVSIAVSGSKTMPTGQDVVATISTTGAISVQINDYANFTSMADLSAKINAAITEANEGKQHAGGTFSFTAQPDPFTDANGNAVTLTGAEITGSNFGTKFGEVKNWTIGAFGGGMNIKKVSSNFVGSGTVDPESGAFKATYGTDAATGKAFWNVEFVVNGKTYSGKISEDTEATSLLLQNTVDGDSIEVSSPSFKDMSAYYKKQNGGADPADGNDMNAYATGKGPGNLTVVPSTKSRDLGMGDTFILTGGTEGGAVTLDELSSIAIGIDGTVTVTHPDKGTVVAGKIALATFGNPSGLKQEGTNYYSATVNSGDPKLVAPGTNGTGGLKSNTLEMSNVDLSAEFSDMITTQRGFQANSRVITVSDTMLEELINLKR